MKITVLFIFAFSFIGHYKLMAQFEKVEQTIYFQSNLDNPIEIEVFDRDGKYQFVANNRSFYPYQLELNLKNVSNMTPMHIHKTYTVLTGKTTLLTLSVIDKEKSHFYDYSMTYKIGFPSKNIDNEFPYLIPVNNKFDLVYTSDSTKYLIDNFKLTKGDTIFNMRKGYIAAIPNMFHSADRISDNSALEIIHDDGTIMIYKNINPDFPFVNIGTTIFPMQPLGIINDQTVLEVYLYMNDGNGNLKNLRINYCSGENLTEEFSNTLKDKKIVHPRETITLEMTKRDKKRYQNATLYK